MSLVHLSIGANLGDPRANCIKACEELDQIPQLSLVERSGLYETEPQGVTDQAVFVNLALALETDLAPHELLRTLKELEAQLGRVPGKRWGPRALDMDILLWGDRVIQTSDLEVPHPRMHQRRFVLAPLADIAPDLSHPILKRSIREMLDDLKDEGGWVKPV